MSIDKLRGADLFVCGDVCHPGDDVRMFYGKRKGVLRSCGGPLLCATILSFCASGAWAHDDESHHEEAREVAPPVTGVRTIAPAPEGADPASEFDAETVEALAPRSAQDLLRAMPGMHLAQHGSEGKAAQFFLRGFDAAHGTDVTLSVGGLALNEASHIHGHGYADLGLVIPEVLQGVRLRRGPFDLDQGSMSTAGDVNFDLGVPAHRRGLIVGGEGGWPLRGRIFVVSAPEERTAADFIAAEAVADQGPFENRQTSRGGVIFQRQVENWRFRGAIQSATFGLPGALPLRDIEAGRVQRSATYTPHTSGEAGQVWLGGQYSGGTGGYRHETGIDLRGRQFDARENFTGFLLDPVHGDDRREFHRGLSLVATHRSRWELSERWEALLFVGGGVDRFRQFADAVDSAGTFLERERGGEGWQSNFYVAPGVDGLIGERLEISGGVRVEGMYFDFREDEEVGGQQGQELVGVVAPRVRTTWLATEQLSVFLALGRGYRGPEARVVAREEVAPPDRDLRFYRGGSPTISTVDAVEVGVRAVPLERVTLTLTGFGFYSESEYIYDHVSRLNIDIGETRRLGAELSAHVHLTENLHLRGHVTATEARFVEEEGAIPFIPPFEGGLFLHGVHPSGVAGGAHVHGTSRRPLPFEAQAPASFLADLHVGYRRAGWTLALHVENVLNSQWYEGVYHYASHFQREEPRSALPAIHVVTGHPRALRLQLSYRWQ